MIARCLTAPLLLLATLTAALHAAAPAGPDPKSARPAAPPPGTKNSPAAPGGAVPPDGPAPTVAAPAAVPAASKEAPAEKSAATTPAPTPAPAPAETATAATDAATATAAPAVKPGILTAVKAKGPPPVGKHPVAPVPLSPRFQQIRTKIGALFDPRTAPPPAPDPRTNPFRPAGALPLAPLPIVEGAEPPPVVANSDLTSLQQAVATIRVKGTVQRGKIMQLVITSAPGKEGTYKEGDIINVALPAGDPVHVRVRVISAHSVTLTLNDAEMVLKF